MVKSSLDPSGSIDKPRIAEDWIVHPGYRRRMRQDGILETVIVKALSPEDTADCIRELAKFSVNGILRERVSHEAETIITASNNRMQVAVDAAKETFAGMTSIRVAFIVQTDFAFALCRQMTMRMDFANTRFAVVREEEQAEAWLNSDQP